MKMMIVKDVEKTRFLSQKDLLTRFNRLSGCQIRDGVYQLVSCMKDGSYLRYNDLGNIEEEILSSSLHRVFTGGECGHQPGLDKYVVALTFDPRTVNEHLYLSENNTKVTRRREKQQLPDNNERFDKCNQVLSRQPLIGRRFFTVDVIGQDVHVGVACKAMQRKGASDAVCLGHNKFSWSLCLSDNSCVARHNNKTVLILSESVRRLGVLVDQDAGSVCFYMLSPQRKVLYVFDADFPEDQELYAAFRIQEPNSEVLLGQESLQMCLQLRFEIDSSEPNRDLAKQAAIMNTEPLIVQQISTRTE